MWQKCISFTLKLENNYILLTIKFSQEMQWKWSTKYKMKHLPLQEVDDVANGLGYSKIRSKIFEIWLKGSISSTFYVRIFRTNIVLAAFFLVTCTLRVWRSYEKRTSITLIKLTEGKKAYFDHFNTQTIRNVFQPFSSRGAFETILSIWRNRDTQNNIYMIIIRELREELLEPMGSAEHRLKNTDVMYLRIF